MKKIFMILSVCLMATLAVVGCQKKAGDDNEKNNTEEPVDGPEDPAEEAFSMDVAIDGNFAEWDKLTADTADGEYYIYAENENDAKTGELRLKLTSDEDYIYVYTELNYENIYVAEGGPYSLGNSNDGFHDHHPGTPGPFWVYIGGDDDATGAVASVTDEDGESYWTYTGFDAPLQYYFCWDVAQDKMQLGWQQVNYPVFSEDHPVDTDWGRPFGKYDTGEGWDPATDNIASTEGDVKFSGVETVTDPVTGSQVQVIKIELGIARDGILQSGDPVKSPVVIGTMYENRGNGAASSPHLLSGRIPSGSTAITLKLK